MTTKQGQLVRLNTNPMTEGDKPRAQAAMAVLHDFNQQCLRVLRCTAKAMASTPGGLRFKPGTRPWLEGLPGRPAAQSPGSSGVVSRRQPAVLQTVSD